MTGVNRRGGASLLMESLESSVICFTGRLGWLLMTGVNRRDEACFLLELLKSSVIYFSRRVGLLLIELKRIDPPSMIFY